jgi:hypothetical protein
MKKYTLTFALICIIYIGYGQNIQAPTNSNFGAYGGEISLSIDGNNIIATNLITPTLINVTNQSVPIYNYYYSYYQDDNWLKLQSPNVGLSDTIHIDNIDNVKAVYSYRRTMWNSTQGTRYAYSSDEEVFVGSCVGEYSNIDTIFTDVLLYDTIFTDVLLYDTIFTDLLLYDTMFTHIFDTMFTIVPYFILDSTLVSVMPSIIVERMDIIYSLETYLESDYGANVNIINQLGQLVNEFVYFANEQHILDYLNSGMYFALIDYNDGKKEIKSFFIN